MHPKVLKEDNYPFIFQLLVAKFGCTSVENKAPKQITTQKRLKEIAQLYC